MLAAMCAAGCDRTVPEESGNLTTFRVPQPTSGDVAERRRIEALQAEIADLEARVTRMSDTGRSTDAAALRARLRTIEADARKIDHLGDRRSLGDVRADGDASRPRDLIDRRHYNVIEP